MKLSNKVAIITGATGDIGKATAKKFVAEGAKVMLAGRSDEKLTNLQQELGDSAHKSCLLMPAPKEGQQLWRIKR